MANRNEPRTPPDVDSGEAPDMRADQHWRVSKQIPLALILVIAGQTFGVAWWAATLSSRVDVLERQMMSAAPLSERLVRLETKFDSVKETVDKIEALIRQPARAP